MSTAVAAIHAQRTTAHEINNHLFAILGLVDLCLAEVEPGSRIHARLELMRSSGLEIKEIVRRARTAGPGA